MAAISTAEKPRGVPFEPGNNANPAGRPRGSRNKLGEAFISALCDDFEKHGVAAIEKVRDTDPSTYLRVIAKVVPQEILFREARMDDLSDDELTAYLLAVREALVTREQAGGGEAAPGADQQASDVPAVSEAKAIP